MSRRKSKGLTIDWDQLTTAAVKAAREAHWGSLPQHEDTIACPKCAGEVMVTGWRDTGVARCINTRLFGGMLDTRPPTCDWSAHVRWDGTTAVVVDAPSKPTLGSDDLYVKMSAAFKGG